MITLKAIEAALNEGRLYARMRNEKIWQLRRNGATKRWKTRPADYSVPVKAGLRTCGRITETSEIVEHTGAKPANCYYQGTVYVVERI